MEGRDDCLYVENGGDPCASGPGDSEGHAWVEGVGDLYVAGVGDPYVEGVGDSEGVRHPYVEGGGTHVTGSSDDGEVLELTEPVLVVLGEEQSGS